MKHTDAVKTCTPAESKMAAETLKFRRRGAALWARLSKDPAGNTTMVMAFLLPVLMGGLAFGAEAGVWQQTQRRLQHAVDAAAHAAATQLRSGVSSEATLKGIARPIAEAGGYVGGDPGIAVSTPPSTGGFAGNSSAVRVELAHEVKRNFTGIFDKSPLVFNVSAVALVSPGRPACILSLHATEDGAIAAGGSANVTLTGCDIAANSVSSSAVQTTGGAVDVVAGCVTAVGGISDPHSAITYTDCTGPIENGPVTADPYRSVAEPTVDVGTCQNANAFTNAGNPSRPSPGCFQNVGNINRDIELSPGVYVLHNSDLRLNGGRKITGTGVTIFMSGNSTIQVNGNSTFDIEAPLSGPYSGIAIFGDRDSAGEFDLTGNSGVSIVGAVYSPNSDVKFTGNNSTFTTGQCTQVIGGTVTFWGNSDFDTDCSASGTREVRTGQLIRIVE